MPVTSETELIVELGDESTDRNQLVLDSVELQAERDSDPLHGVGNELPQGIRRGNITYTASYTAHMNQSAADAVEALELEGSTTGAMDVSDGIEGEHEYVPVEMYWNSVRTEASDGGDTIVEMEFDVLDVEGALPGGDTASGAAGDDGA